MYKGTYHVLGGLISPLDGIGPEQLHIPELIRTDHFRQGKGNNSSYKCKRRGRNYRTIHTTTT
jgi:hypothetical protein